MPAPKRKPESGTMADDLSPAHMDCAPLAAPSTRPVPTRNRPQLRGCKGTIERAVHLNCVNTLILRGVIQSMPTVIAQEIPNRATTRSAPQPAHVKALDGIRGLAAMMVLLYHYGDLSHSSSRIMQAIEFLKERGNSGVDVFFVLSGFLITGVLLDATSTSHRWRNFFARRALRLFPLYYGVWALLILYLFVHRLPWAPSNWAYLFYLGNFAHAQNRAIGPFVIGHFWSLAVEEQFYLLWPLIVWKINNVRRLTYVLVALCGISFLIKLAFILLHQDLDWTHFLLPTRMEGLATGSLCAIAVRRLLFSRSLAIARWVFPCSLLTLVGIEIAAGLHRPIFGNLLWFQTMALASGSMLLLSLEPGTWASSILGMAPLRFVGRYSYGTYVYMVLIHNWLGLHLKPITNRIPQETLANVVYLLACIAIIIAISMASFRFVEQPFLRLKRHFK